MNLVFRRFATILTATLILCAAIACATSSLPISDADLVRRSVAIVQGWVGDVRSFDAPGGIVTEISVEPERVLKGVLGASTLVVRADGGSVGDRMQWIWESPQFWNGEHVLLFLERQRPDGYLGVIDLFQGAWQIGFDAQSRPTAFRLEGDHATRLLTPWLVQLQRWIGTGPLPAALPAALPGAGELQAAFTLFSNARHFEPDVGQTVKVRIGADGDAQLGPVASRAAADAALQAWSSLPNASMVLEDAGTFDPLAAFTPCVSGDNRVWWNNRNGSNAHAISAGCGSILAVTGFCSAGGQHRMIGSTDFGWMTTYYTIVNSGCGYTAEHLIETLTHETGHGTGLGHSTDPNATMAPYAHWDNRGNKLMPDDIAGEDFIYPLSGSPKPAVTYPVPAATPTRTAWRPSTATATRTATPRPTATMRPGVPTTTSPPVPTATTTTGGAGGLVTCVIGDIDGSGTVTVDDAMALQARLNAYTHDPAHNPLPPLAVCDVTGNHVCDWGDYRYLYAWTHPQLYVRPVAPIGQPCP